MALRGGLVEPGEAFARAARIEQHLPEHRLRFGNPRLGALANKRRPLLRRTGEAGGDLLGGELVERVAQNLSPIVAKAERPGAIAA
jgi:hypothetical protein